MRSIGRHQAQNAALAVAALGVALEQEIGAKNGTRFAMSRPSTSAIETALEKARWPGRLEVLEDHPNVWVDGAHNPSGARTLLRAWRDGLSNAPATLVLACTDDKNIDTFLKSFQGPWRHVIATEASNPRAFSAERLARKAEAIFGVTAEAITPVSDAIEKAVQQARGREHVMIAGSLYLVGEALSILGVDPTQELT